MKEQDESIKPIELKRKPIRFEPFSPVACVKCSRCEKEIFVGLSFLGVGSPGEIFKKEMIPMIDLLKFEKDILRLGWICLSSSKEWFCHDCLVSLGNQVHKM